MLNFVFTVKWRPTSRYDTGDTRDFLEPNPDCVTSEYA